MKNPIVAPRVEQDDEEDNNDILGDIKEVEEDKTIMPACPFTLRRVFSNRSMSFRKY